MEAGGEEDHNESADDKRRGHHESIFAKRESAGPVKSRVVEGMPAEAAHEVVLNNGERGEHGCKKNGTEQDDAFHE